MKHRENKIDYEEVMKLGFTRIEPKDSVWERQCGFPYFIVDLDIGLINFNWSIRNHHVSMNELDAEANILRTRKFINIDELSTMIQEVEDHFHTYKERVDAAADEYEDMINQYFNENTKENK